MSVRNTQLLGSGTVPDWCVVELKPACNDRLVVHEIGFQTNPFRDGSDTYTPHTPQPARQPKDSSHSTPIVASTERGTGPKSGRA